MKSASPNPCPNSGSAMPRLFMTNVSLMCSWRCRVVQAPQFPRTSYSRPFAATGKCCKWNSLFLFLYNTETNNTLSYCSGAPLYTFYDWRHIFPQSAIELNRFKSSHHSPVINSCCNQDEWLVVRDWSPSKCKWDSCLEKLVMLLAPHSGRNMRKNPEWKRLKGKETEYRLDECWCFLWLAG